MRASSVLNFQHTAVSSLRRPWQTFKDGQIFYGLTKRGSKRHPLTSKQGNKDFYKGTRSSGIGFLDKHAKYIVNWDRVRTYVVPADLNSTPLKALVSGNCPQLIQRFEGYLDEMKSPELAWNNIKDFIEYGENYNDIDVEQTDFLEEFVHPDVNAAEQEDNTVIRKD